MRPRSSNPGGAAASRIRCHAQVLEQLDAAPRSRRRLSRPGRAVGGNGGADRCSVGVTGTARTAVALLGGNARVLPADIDLADTLASQAATALAVLQCASG